MKKTGIGLIVILCFLICSTLFAHAAEPVSPAYEISAQEIKEFKKGETVTVTFKVDKIQPDSGILGFDINLRLNKDYVTTPIVNEDIEKANASNTTISALNTKGGKWTISGRMDNKDDSVLIITILEDNAVDAVMPGKSFEFMVAFIAKADSAAGAEIITTDEAAGTSGDIETLTGKGTSVTVSGSTPTDSPTAEPTATQAAAPTPTSEHSGENKPNPTTADLGIISIAAMALSSFTVLKKKYKK